MNKEIFDHISQVADTVILVDEPLTNHVQSMSESITDACIGAIRGIVGAGGLPPKTLEAVATSMIAAYGLVYKALFEEYPTSESLRYLASIAEATAKKIEP